MASHGHRWTSAAILLAAVILAASIVGTGWWLNQQAMQRHNQDMALQKELSPATKSAVFMKSPEERQADAMERQTEALESISKHLELQPTALPGQDW